jgi:hypothetical protein
MIERTKEDIQQTATFLDEQAKKLSKKIALTFDDTPKMRSVLRHLAEYASVWGSKIVVPEDRSAEYEAFDDAVARAIDDEELGALVTPFEVEDGSSEVVGHPAKS